MEIDAKIHNGENIQKLKKYTQIITDDMQDKCPICGSIGQAPKVFKRIIFLAFSLQETEPKLSPSWNPKIIYEPHPQLTRSLPEVTPSDPVQIGELIGKLELSLTLKQNEVLPGAKVGACFSVLQ